MNTCLLFQRLKQPLCGGLILFVLFVLPGCGRKRASSDVKSALPSRLEVPAPPVSLVSSQDRGRFLLAHYWDNFDFADTLLIHRPEFTEQAFVDFLDLFPHVDSTSREETVVRLLDKISSTDSVMFAHFTGMFERYLYDPNSPMRNEEFYLPVLRYLVNSEKVGEVAKIRPRYLLAMALKNRPGMKASDFSFRLTDGTRRKLSSVKSDYVVVFFNNPDCHDCARVKSLLEQVNSPRVKVVAIYPDEEVELWEKSRYPAKWINGCAPELRTDQLYDLRAIPTLYLLDKDRTVIFKDVPVEVLLKYLAENKI